jgi:hypothetical protein
MKRETIQQKNPEPGEADGRRTGEMSAESEIQEQIAELAEWLAAHGLDPRAEPAHADEGSRDRLYWRYGYFIGLKQALAMLTNHGETVH